MSVQQINVAEGDGIVTPHLQHYIQRLLNVSNSQPFGIPGPSTMDPIVPLSLAMFDSPSAADGVVTEDNIGTLIGYYDLYKHRADDETDNRAGTRIETSCKVETLEDGKVKYTLVGEFNSTQGNGVVNKLRVLGGTAKADEFKTTAADRLELPLKSCFVKSQRYGKKAIVTSTPTYRSTASAIAGSNLSASYDDWIVLPTEFEFGNNADTERQMRVLHNPGLNTPTIRRPEHMEMTEFNFTHTQVEPTRTGWGNNRTILTKNLDVYIFTLNGSMQNIDVARYRFEDGYAIRVDLVLNLPAVITQQRTFGIEIDESDVLHVVFADVAKPSTITYLTYDLEDMTTPISSMDIQVTDFDFTDTTIAQFHSVVLDEDDANIVYLLTRSFRASTSTYTSINRDQSGNFTGLTATRLTVDGSLNPVWLGMCTVGYVAMEGTPPRDTGLSNWITGSAYVGVPALDGDHERVYDSSYAPTIQHYDRKRKIVRSTTLHTGDTFVHAFVPVNHVYPVLAEVNVPELLKTEDSQLRVEFELTLDGTIA